jgi:tryptophanyl-tRNA synthetase
MSRFSANAERTFPHSEDGASFCITQNRNPESINQMPESAILSSRPRVLSGMRPTGKLHLGNYMGALANWVKLQDAYECYFFIADWHALTTDYADPSRIKLNTLDVALDFLAAGLDPEKSTIFIQSHVPQHAELNLLLGMMTPLGWLERVPTYKEQQENLTSKDLTNFGFLGYPVLMASDILLYQTQFVPVGQDQTAHVELTREVARRFNSMYKKRLDDLKKSVVFPEPEALYTPVPKVPGLDGRKMSKSYGNTIGLTEAESFTATKIGNMSTNGQRIRQTDAGDPDLCPVSDLHKVFSSADILAVTQQGCRAASLRCADCKDLAFKSVRGIIGPFHEKRLELESNIEQTWQMLRDQSAKAAKRAEQTMVDVREIFDLSRELGSVKRYFGVSEEELNNRRNLNQFEDLRRPIRTENEIDPLLPSHWLVYLLPKEIAITIDSDETWLTSKKKRVLTIAGTFNADEKKWNIEVPQKSYEVWVLLCRDGKNWLEDFVLPQKYFSQPYAKAKKSLKKDEKIPVTIRKIGERFLLSIHGSEPIDITELRGNYAPLN